MTVEAPVIVTRRRSDCERAVEMHVEFIGGPLDGQRAILDVVVEAPTQIRVLERGYTRVAPVLMASEVESAQ